jgi:hypothetical protein
VKTKEEKRSSALGKSSSFVDKYLTEKSSKSSNTKSSFFVVESEKSKKPYESISTEETFKRDVAVKNSSTEQILQRGSIKLKDSLKNSSTTDSVRRKVFGSEKKNDSSVERYNDFPPNYLEENVKENKNTSTNVSVESVRRKEFLAEKLPIRQKTIDTTKSDNQSVRLKDSWKPTTSKISVDSFSNGARKSSTSAYVDQSLNLSMSTASHPISDRVSAKSDSFNPLRHSKSAGGWSNSTTSCRLEEG